MRAVCDRKLFKLPQLSLVSVFFLSFSKMFEMYMNREASCIRVNSQSKFSLYLTPLLWFLIALNSLSLIISANKSL